MGIYNIIGLTFATLYAFEPIFTWIRLSFMRIANIEEAVKFRANLIKEAKERKEERKQKKLAAFNNFVIDVDAFKLDTINHEEAEADDDVTLDESSSAIKKSKTKKAKPWTEIDVVKEEKLEETLTSDDPLKALA